MRARPPDTDADAVVLGAGLAGAAIARELASRKRRVVLVGATGDALDPSLGHVLVGPGIPYGDAARRWGRAQAREIWEGQRENGDRLRLFVESLRGGCDYRRAGGFLLAGDREQGQRLAEGEDMLREDGFPGEFLEHVVVEELAGEPVLPQHVLALRQPLPQIGRASCRERV